MKNLLWVSHSGRVDGGSELSLYALVKLAKEQGYQQHVVVPSPGGLDKKLQQLGVDCTIIPFTWWTRGGQKSWQDLRHNVRATGKLDDLIRSLVCDVVISNTSVFPWAALASTRARVPHVWMIREFGKSDQGLRFILGQGTYRFINRFSALITANSQAVKNYLSNFIKPADKIIVCYPIVDTPSLGRKNKPNEAGVEIIMVGNIRETKGQLEVVKALCRLPSPLLDTIRLTLIGPYQDQEKQKIEDYLKTMQRSGLVKFVGPQPDPAEFLAKADIYIMASKNEAFGRVSVEAMRAGLPVIGSRSGATPEIVRHEETGLLYESGNIEALTKAIAQLAGDAELRSRMGKSGQKRAEQFFNPNAVSQSFFASLDSLPPTSPEHRWRAAFITIIVLLSLASLVRLPYRLFKFLMRHGD